MLPTLTIFSKCHYDEQGVTGRGVLLKLLLVGTQVLGATGRQRLIALYTGHGGVYGVVLGLHVLGGEAATYQPLGYGPAYHRSGYQAKGGGCHGDGGGSGKAHLLKHTAEPASRAVSAGHGDGACGHAHQGTDTQGVGNAERHEVLHTDNTY